MRSHEFEEKKNRGKLYLKWWFWLFIVLIFLVIGFVAIMYFGFNTATSGINEIALKVQEIDNDATVYISAGENTIIVEMPNYTDDTKKEKKEKIEKVITKYAKNDEILSNYSKFIFIRKSDSDDNKDYFYYINVYSLPDMTEIEDESKVYIDFVEFYLESLSSSSTSDSADTSTTTSTGSTSNKGEDITLSQGNYTVGEDVKAGKYDIIAIDGTEGNIYVKGKVNAVLSDQTNNYGWEKTYNNVTLTSGDVIEITNGLRVTLQAK